MVSDEFLDFYNTLNDEEKAEVNKVIEQLKKDPHLNAIPIGELFYIDIPIPKKDTNDNG